MGKQCPGNCSSSLFGLLTFSCLLQYSTQTENYGFSQWVDPPAIRPYQVYNDYLEDVVIYNPERKLSKALASPDPSSSAGDSRCCKCSTCTYECPKKINSPPPKDCPPPPSPPPPPPGYYYMLSQHFSDSFLNFLRHVTTT
jgi:hypothetical protein